MAEEDPRSRAEEEGDLIKGVSTLLAGAAMLGPLVILGIATYGWLRSGLWSTPRTWEALSYMGITYPYLEDWQGVQKVLSWFLDLPLWIGGSLTLWAIALPLWEMGERAHRKG